MPEVFNLHNPGVLLLPIHNRKQLHITNISHLAHLHPSLIEQVRELVLAKRLLFNLHGMSVRVDEFQRGYHRLP